MYKVSMFFLRPLHVMYLIFDFINRFKLVQIALSVVIWILFYRMDIAGGGIDGAADVVSLCVVAGILLLVDKLLWGLLTRLLNLILRPFRAANGKYQEKKGNPNGTQHSSYGYDQTQQEAFSDDDTTYEDDPYENTQSAYNSAYNQFDWNAYQRFFYERNTGKTASNSTGNYYSESQSTDSTQQTSKYSFDSELEQALQVMGFTEIPEEDIFKKKKREMLKKYHPDVNPGKDALEMTERILRACEKIEHYY